MMCEKMKTKKYTSRKSPSYVAMSCPGEIKEGNDGNKYISKQTKNGSYRWYKVKTPTSQSTAATTNVTNVVDSITLYRLSSANKLLQWTAEMKQVGDTYIIHKEHGQKNGKKVKDTGVVISVGKAGRSVLEQAQLQYNSIVQKKRDLGYTEDVSGQDENFHLSPMLAQNYTKHGHKITFPALAQPKLDGVRCIFRNINGKCTLLSRKGKPFHNLDHIITDILKTGIDSDIALDGELFSDTFDFQKVVGVVRKKELKKEEDKRDVQKIQFNVFDCVHLKQPDIPFHTRWNMVDTLIKKVHKSSLRIVPIHVIKNATEIETRLDAFLKDGHEGIMLRNRNSPYEIDKRSYHLQKYKKFVDSEYRIVDATEGTGNDKGTVIWICETTDKQTFKVKPKGTRKERRELFTNKSKYMGKFLTVQYQELTNSGIPRFPIGITFRDYE